MAASGPPPGGSWLKAAGIVLLVVAAAATVIGLLSLVGPGAGPVATGPITATTRSARPVPPTAPTAPRAPAPSPIGPSRPSTPATPAPGSSVAPASGVPGGHAAPTPPPPPPVAPPPAPPAAPPGAQSGVGELQRSVTVRVYNNSTIRGLAASGAEQLRERGWTVTEVGNYPFGRIPTTTVYYRPGTTEQAAAQEMGSEFGMRVLPRFPGIENASPGLIVILTDDFRGGQVK